VDGDVGGGLLGLPLAPVHVFVVYDARAGGALLGPPGALPGAFAMSAVMHDLGMWASGAARSSAPLAGSSSSWASGRLWSVRSRV